MSFQSAVILVIMLGGSLVGYLRGGAPERMAAIIISVWIGIDAVNVTLFGSSNFDGADPFEVVLDSSELVAMGWLALRANRMWPLWAAAAQLICVSGHAAAIIEPGGMRRAYWAMTQLPQYIQLTALLLGAAAHARRERQVGPYRSWREA